MRLRLPTPNTKPSSAPRARIASRVTSNCAGVAPYFFAKCSVISCPSAKKYGATPAQLEVTREAIRERGAELGFVFGVGKRSRIYNTFDAHRMLHWAGLEDDQYMKQRALKHALFAAYFTEGFNPGEHETILRAVAQVGLDVDAARAVLESDDYATEVRAQEEHYLARGIHSVPAVIVNNQHLIHGGQPPEVFEQALRQITSAQV